MPKVEGRAEAASLPSEATVVALQRVWLPGYFVGRDKIGLGARRDIEITPRITFKNKESRKSLFRFEPYVDEALVVGPRKS